MGQTTKRIEKRLYDHMIRMRHDTPIGEAIKKYKKENFLCQIIEGFNSQLELDKAEKFYIKALDTLVSKNEFGGYNLKKGGNGGEFHEETIKKLVESHTYCKFTGVTKRRLSGDEIQRLIQFKKEELWSYEMLGRTIGVSFGAVRSWMTGEKPAKPNELALRSIRDFLDKAGY